jgi:hypothetical protein
MHVELGSNAKCGIEGVGTVRFQLELGGSPEVADVLYVLELKMNLFSISALEDKGFAVLFQNEQVLIHLEGANPNATVSIGVREVQGIL